MLIMKGALPKDGVSDPIRKKPFSCKIGIHRRVYNNSGNKICEKCGKEFQRSTREGYSGQVYAYESPP